MYIMATSTKEKCLELAKQLYKGYTSRIEVKEEEKTNVVLISFSPASSRQSSFVNIHTNMSILGMNMSW